MEESQSPTLLVLAAGMGSRYGGLKQLDPMGPDGETLLDYSVRDAAAAGFGRVVFVIRRDMETAFRDTVGGRYEDLLDVRYAFQELDDLPHGFQVPANRTKPWGTAHAVRAARAQLDTPFAVINADDYYGPEAFRALAKQLASIGSANTSPLPLCMIGYRLRNTLSPHGSVNRGICEVGATGLLQSIRECEDLAADPEHPDSIVGKDSAGTEVTVPADAVVSMNCWGLPAAILSFFEDAFREFLETRGAQLKSEWYLPALIDDLMRAGRVRCAVIPTEARWFGVTYPDDRPRVQQALAELRPAP